MSASPSQVAAHDDHVQDTRRGLKNKLKGFFGLGSSAKADGGAGSPAHAMGGQAPPLFGLSQGGHLLDCFDGHL